MDQKDLGLERFDAGAEFLTSISKLGLKPEALLWAYDRKIEQFVLVLITNFFDFAGPLELSKRLFAAYNACALPKSIDPFIIRPHSPHQKIYRELTFSLQTTVSLGLKDRIGPARRILSGETERVGHYHFTYGGLESYDSWVYLATTRVKRSIEAEPSWRRFDKAVKALAA